MMRGQSLGWALALCVLVLFAIIFLGLPLIELNDDRVNLFPLGNSSLKVLHSIGLIVLTFCLVAVTGLLAYVADKQLKAIGDSAKADFLMRMDDRYASESILKARCIIQRLYRESKVSK